MSNAHVSVWGRLAADPEQREGKSGKPWATARLAVTMPLPYGADEGSAPPTLWLNLVAFGERLADTLARHRKGECLSIAGALELRPYTARDGSKRDGLTVIASDVIGPRSPRPKGGGKRTPARSDPGPVAGDRARQDPPPFDDELPW